jgi:hypothetical protein
MKLYEVTQNDLDKLSERVKECEDAVPNLYTWMLLAVKFRENILPHTPDEEGVLCWGPKSGKRRLTLSIKQNGKLFTVQLSRFAFYMYNQEFEKYVLNEQYKCWKEKKKFIHTSCKNKFCFNPDHLFESFTAYYPENVPKAPKGSECAQSKLAEEQVLEIRETPGALQTLATKYNVSKTAISNIKRRLSWRHLLPKE